jgi:hypothetical protein
MRRIAFVGTAVSLALLLGLPAQAKVAGQATISGPGLGDGGGPGSITLSGSDGGGWAAFSGLLDVGATGLESAPTKDLGPRYRVVLDVRQPPQRDDVVQYLYPYARDGALIYTPPGQQLLDFDAPSGWRIATRDLLDLVHEAGLPEESPVARAPISPATGVAAPASEGISPVVWATIAMASLLVAGALVTRRRVRMAIR